jgi:putative transposase
MGKMVREMVPDTISCLNVFSDNKLQQKLDYMHNNPVTRGLVSSPGDWPWSSWRFYYLEDESILRMDRMG